MTTQSGTKHYFPCSNTSKGFYSYFENLLCSTHIDKVYILKGGPGVGKSTFMKKMGEEFHEKSLDVEYLHCSLDDNSLDGIIIPKIKCAFVNGTLPHIIDMKNPICVEEIINLDEYCSAKEVCTYKQNIIELNKEIDNVFSRSYKYLGAAYQLINDTSEIYNQGIDHGKVNLKISETCENVFNGLNHSSNLGRKRKMFAGSITCFGLKNYISTIINNLDNLYIIKGEAGTAIKSLFETISQSAVKRGLDVEIFYCGYDYDKIEHILIPQLNIGFVTSNQYHNIYKTNGEEIIDFNEFINQNEIKKYQSQLYFNRQQFNELLNQAILTISEAKRYHDLLESYYTPSVDFSKIDEKGIEILNKILN